MHTSNLSKYPAFLQELGFKVVEQLTRNWRQFVLALALIICLVIALGARAHRRQTARFADLVELCLAMNQWRDNPEGRSGQLSHLRQLFQRQSAMLERFGGSFLQVAIANAEVGAESGNWGRKLFADQQERWLATSNALRRDFERATLAAAQETWSVATQLSLKEVEKFRTRAKPSSALTNQIHQELQAWNLMRAFGVATLAQDLPARTHALAELKQFGQLPKTEVSGHSKIEVSGHSKIEVSGRNLWPAPYQNFSGLLRQGHLTFADWINFGATSTT